MMLARTNIVELLSNVAESMLSLSFNIGGLVAGGILATYLDVFSIRPWAIVLFPAILSVRGAIGGLFSGRLSTSLHLGTIKASYTNNTKSFKLLLVSIVTLAFESSVVIGSAAFIVSSFLWGTPFQDSLEILAVISGTMSMSILFVSPITMAASFTSFKHGLNPDITVYPITSTFADVIITLCYITVLGTFFGTESGPSIVYLIDLLFILMVLISLARNLKEEDFLKTLKEFQLTLLFVAIIVNITGSMLNAMRSSIGERIEVYAVYPALITTMGSFGSIVGSTATTKLFTGLINPFFSSMKDHLTQILSAWTASAIMFTIYMGIASVGYNVDSGGYSSFFAELLTTNILAASVMACIAYAIAILTFRHALDPDNFVIPIESSIADAVTTIFLFVALKLFS